ncbi:hypothetical protein M5K25_011571 [Dendrobium thyrsiflorum]|uniref:Uncharacterized protein n=1 Tax=Dendrobium thyrsiflorum TaxID=117978 RepID=A0ABD0VA56_DENTH
MSMVQMRKLGAGLEMSGFRFLWVVKGAKVDRDEEEEQEEKGETVRESRGLMVVREWVDQGKVLGHKRSH